MEVLKQTPDAVMCSGPSNLPKSDLAQRYLCKKESRLCWGFLFPGFSKKKKVQESNVCPLSLVALLKE